MEGAGNYHLQHSDMFDFKGYEIPVNHILNILWWLPYDFFLV